MSATRACSLASTWAFRGGRAESRRKLALDVVNALRDDGVLISTTGANEDTLKVRPTLICEAEHVDLFLARWTAP